MPSLHLSQFLLCLSRLSVLQGSPKSATGSMNTRKLRATRTPLESRDRDSQLGAVIVWRGAPDVAAELVHSHQNCRWRARSTIRFVRGGLEVDESWAPEGDWASKHVDCLGSYPSMTRNKTRLNAIKSNTNPMPSSSLPDHLTTLTLSLGAVVGHPLVVCLSATGLPPSLAPPNTLLISLHARK